DAGDGAICLPAHGVAWVQPKVPWLRRRRRLHTREVPTARRPDSVPAVPPMDAPLQPALWCALSQYLGRQGPQLHDRLPRAWPRHPATRGALQNATWGRACDRNLRHHPRRTRTLAGRLRRPLDQCAIAEKLIDRLLHLTSNA